MDTTTGQAPTTPQVEPAAEKPTTPQAPHDAEPKTFDAEYVRQLRTEAATNRKRATDLEAQLKVAEDAKLSDQQRLEKRAKDGETALATLAEQHHVTVIRYEVKLMAAELGIVDPDAAVALMPAGALEYDEAGQPTNIRKALEALLKAKPYLKAQVEPAAGNRPGPKPTGDGKNGTTAEKEQELRRRYRL